MFGEVLKRISLIIISLGVALSWPQAASAETSRVLPTRSAVIEENYTSLSMFFSDDELSALDEISTTIEIEQLVAVIEAPEVVGQNKIATRAVATRQNGCSFTPDRWGSANFKPICDRHDICYSPSSRINRIDCDKRFRAGLIAECVRAYGSGVRSGACKGVAEAYYRGVRAAGSRFYKGRGLNN